MIDYAQLPNTLRGLRQNRGFSQQNMAEALHVSRSTYSYWEEGKTRPSAEELQSIAVIFGISSTIFLSAECGETLKAEPVRANRRGTEEIDLVGHLNPEERRLIALLRSQNALDICSRFLEAIQGCS